MYVPRMLELGGPPEGCAHSCYSVILSVPALSFRYSFGDPYGEQIDCIYTVTANYLQSICSALLVNCTRREEIRKSRRLRLRLRLLSAQSNCQERDPQRANERVCSVWPRTDGAVALVDGACDSIRNPCPHQLRHGENLRRAAVRSIQGIMDGGKLVPSSHRLRVMGIVVPKVKRKQVEKRIVLADQVAERIVLLVLRSS